MGMVSRDGALAARPMLAGIEDKGDVAALAEVGVAVSVAADDAEEGEIGGTGTGSGDSGCSLDGLIQAGMGERGKYTGEAASTGSGETVADGSMLPPGGVGWDGAVAILARRRPSNTGLSDSLLTNGVPSFL